ncbi:transcriptional adaptor ADA2, putative [Babesia ovis]|uniref:Transcriptional adaptor ADA2, putative n=1 Tax=Babesia ovis TaxID=5869 RepID=A0A9W5WUP4_BABOV|nr:transcriptional adaptor ADA2, putative [Babesia ovis]
MAEPTSRDPLDLDMIDVIGFPINTQLEDDTETDHIVTTPVRKKQVNWRRRPLSNSLQRTHMFNFTTKTSREYRDLEVMYRIYDICTSMMIQDPESVYSLFLERLKTRVKLERRHDRLELLTAVLYYLDQRRANRTINVRDAICRLGTYFSGVNLRRFVKEISNICTELNIHSLPVVPNINLVRNMLDELVIELGNTFASVSEHHSLSHTSDVNKMLNEIYSMQLSQGAEAPTSSDGSSCYQPDDIAPTQDTATSIQSHIAQKPGLFNINPSRRKLLATTLNNNYDVIVDNSIRLIVFCQEHGLELKTDIMDPQSRKQFHCRKSFLASVISIVISMLGIRIHHGLMLHVWNIVRSSYYRYCDSILLLVSRVLIQKYHVAVNSKKLIYTFLKHILRKLDNDIVSQCAYSSEYKATVSDSVVAHNIEVSSEPDQESRVNCKSGDDNKVLMDNPGGIERTFNKRNGIMSSPHASINPGNSSPHSSLNLVNTGRPRECEGLPEVCFLKNVLGINQVHDDRIWKSSGGTHHGLEDNTNNSGMVNDYDFALNHSDDTSAGSNRIATTHTINKADTLELPAVSSIHRLTLMLAVALGALPKHSIIQKSYDSQFDRGLFKSLTYILQSFDLIQHDPGIKLYYESGKHRYSVQWKLNGRTKVSRFCVKKHGRQLAYLMAQIYMKAISVERNTVLRDIA